MAIDQKCCNEKILDICGQIKEYREKSGMTQVEIAKAAEVTQQQLSKIENGYNCNIATFVRVCSALKLDFNFQIIGKTK